MRRDHDHMGITEIAAFLGVSRQRAHQLAATAAFPEPANDLASGPIWHGDDVRAWAAKHRPDAMNRPDNG